MTNYPKNQLLTTMKRFGLFLLVLGLGSIALHFANMEFRLLTWIEMWGATVAWVIRGALALAGAVLLVVDAKSEPKPTD